MKRPPWRCRLFGHAMQRVLTEYPAAARCRRAGCDESWHLPHWPPPPPFPTRGVIVGVAGASVSPGEPVTVTLDLSVFPLPGPICGKPRDPDAGGEGCYLPPGHDGGCRASTWSNRGTTTSVYADGRLPLTGSGGDGEVAVYSFEPPTRDEPKA